VVDVRTERRDRWERSSMWKVFEIVDVYEGEGAVLITNDQHW
jgi:hypothetical protein